MFCPSCGSEIEGDATFCPNCGGSLEEKKEVQAAPVEVQEASVITPVEVVQPTQQAASQPASSDKTGFAIAGLVLGLVGLIAWLIPLFGYPVTIVGIVMSVKGLKTSMKGMALAGLILSIAMLVLTFGNSCLGACIAIAGLA